MKSNKNINPKNDSLKDTMKDKLDVSIESSSSSSDVVSASDAAGDEAHGAVQRAYDLSIEPEGPVEDNSFAEAVKDKLEKCKETEKLLKAKDEIVARIDEVSDLVKAATKLEEEEIPDIKARYEYSWAGRRMYRLCAAWTKFVVKHRWLYEVLIYTWGAIMSVIGLVAAGIMRVFGRAKAKRFAGGWTFYQEVGECWGGVSLGGNFFKDKNCTGEETCEHEFGHTFQNALLGPLAIVLAFVPSFVRYWYQTWADKKGKPLKDYDAVWFEGAASDCGRWAAETIKRDRAWKEIMKKAKKIERMENRVWRKEKALLKRGGASTGADADGSETR